MKRHFQRYLLISLLIGFATGCDEENVNTQASTSLSSENQRELDALRKYVRTPIYGGYRTIVGKALFGQENSALAVCESEKSKTCKIPTNVDGSEQLCWLEFTITANEDVDRILQSNAIAHGEYWVEGKGRIAVFPGSFGHAAGFTCQIEMQRVSSFGSGPPWFWSPPP